MTRTPPDTPAIARIEVFRPGTFTPMEGKALTYSAADLRAIADAYDPETAPAPIVVGHPQTDAPAYGWVKGFEFDAQAERLFADVHELDPQFAELVKQGRFKKVSMSFFGPDQSANPNPGVWYPKHLGFLGAAAPAVTGLRNVSLSAGDAITFEFGAPGFEETASILRKLREFLIENFGIEDADKALPSWQIEWIGEMEPVVPDTPTSPPATGFADPAQPFPTSDPQKEPKVSQTDPSFAEREAALQSREDALAAREKDVAHRNNQSFAEGLVTSGKLLPLNKDKVVAILDALPADQTVSFAEGAAKISPADALREVLEAQPEVVSYGALDLPDGPEDGRAAAFASDGKPVDPDQLIVHNAALDYQRKNPGTAYLDAVKAVS